MPKTPAELKEQIEIAKEQAPATSGHERTAEGLDVPTPTRDDFFSNLKKVSKPKL